jgi:hypothetical protein
VALMIGWPLSCALVVRANIGPTLAARLADKLRLDIRQPHMIRPAIGGQGDRVGAAIVTAEDHHAGHARFSHLSERDFLFPRHAPNLTKIGRSLN